MKNVLLFIFLFFAFHLAAQTKPFEINGTIKGMDSGYAEFYPGRGNTNVKINEKKVPIRNGQFVFSGELSYASMVILGFTDSLKTYYTFWFYIDEGNQLVKLDTAKQTFVGEEMDIDVISNSKSWIEYNEKFKPTVEKVKDQEGSNLLKYVKENPKSLVALVKSSSFIRRVYEPVFDSIFNNFDKSLKMTSVGIKISEKLKALKSVEVGAKFPSIPLFDSSSNKIVLDKSLLSQYTLCDFWFNGCGYCIQQMPELNEIYSKWHSKGLEIIGITVDPKDKEQAWKNVIAKQNVKWLQLWDINSVEANKLSVNFFPTSFLLDKSGKIVAVNIKPSELEKFLEAKL